MVPVALKNINMNTKGKKPYDSTLIQNSKAMYVFSTFWTDVIKFDPCNWQTLFHSPHGF